MEQEGLVRLSEYRPYPFAIPIIKLDFSIHEDFVSVHSSMHVEPRSKNISFIELKGENIQLDSIKIDGEILNQENFSLGAHQLIIRGIPLIPFKLDIAGRIDPFNNSKLEGLYISEDLLTTQCEAEGFRRICFHPDRPDVLSKYQVRIEADLKKYPLLLSNGNKISCSTIPGFSSRHEVVWSDPHPKPSYLFALVAGDLDKATDSFITSSGVKINISLYVDKGDLPYTKHAIESLKRAMRWDEEVYGFEYDLDEYNIVAVRHFNMGAMENKSLNIFNSKLVLADPEIATDDELKRIESVIAHEYFHNWTGNRITCRDWFQLSLKEGLTVYRDQSFTSEVHSSSQKRIDDVSFLRNTQFLEDSGPTSHAVKPSQYQSIDNFYTTTIYEKGAEIIRMINTILGNKHFMKGINLYASRFDGCAATTEDFVQSMIDASCNNNSLFDLDIQKFSQWYYQPGTPEVSVLREWEPLKGKLIIKVSQSITNNNNERHESSLLIPLKVAIITNKSDCHEERLLMLDRPQQEFVFEKIPFQEKVPVVSLFRSFSAPVNWNSDLLTEELFHLFKYDNDPFSRWNSGQLLMRQALIARASFAPAKELEDNIILTLDYLIQDIGSKDPEALSSLISLPGLSELELYQENVDPIALYQARMHIESLLGDKLSASLKSLLISINQDCQLEWPKGSAARKMKALAWRLLAVGGDLDVRKKVLNVVQGSSMTMARAALYALHSVECSERELAMRNFYDLWKNRPVILDTWFSLEASKPSRNSLELVQNLLEHPRFDPDAPNSVRAVLGGFTSNVKAFHSIDGTGYQFMADQILELDKRNPITASRMLKVFSRWKSYLSVHREPMFNALVNISDAELSKNTREVVELILS